MPPEPIPRVTLLQISDLHIGEIDPVTGDAVVSTLAQLATANIGIFDGLLGHHATGLQHLHRFWRKLLLEDPNAQVIVSGDVTRCGGSNELNNAQGFIASTLGLPFGRVGLRSPHWRKQAIPGNHDHWPGTGAILGPPDPSVKNGLLKGYPQVRTLRRGPGKPIHLITINTDEDVHHASLYRLLAIGHFQSQLVAAKVQLSRLEEGIRVLVLHHSCFGKKVLLKISRASRGALEQFLDQENISLILTGHMHTHLIRSFAVGPANSSKHVWECRSGTTTQVDKISYGARSLLGGFRVPKWPANSLLVHRITEGNGHGVEWDVQAYVRDRSGFQPFKVRGHETIPLP